MHYGVSQLLLLGTECSRPKKLLHQHMGRDISGPISTISQRANNIISTSLWNWSKLIFRISMNYGVSAQLTKLLSLVSVVAVSPRHLRPESS